MKLCTKSELKQVYHIVGQETKAVINKLRHKNNEAELIGYKKQYVPCTFVNEYFLGSSFYGFSAIMKKYSGYRGVVSGITEHGLYLDTSLNEVKNFNLPSVFTFGEYRQSQLRKATDRAIFQIGPYIKYAAIENPEELIELKESLGKTMLVFPVHTIETTDVAYNADAFINYIKTIKEEMQIQTVLVSLYFLDIPEMAPIYESHGFTVVCSGHRTDRNFLVRQRSYFELSDMVVTNSVGTHLGYAVALGKPVSLFLQTITEELNEIAKVYETRGIDGTIAAKEIMQVFEGTHDEITPEQIEVVEKYWGLSKFRSPEDIRLMLEAADHILKRVRFSNKSYKELFLEYANNCKNMRIRELIIEALQ